MTYTLQAYYQKDRGCPHQPVALADLHEHVGYAIADRIIAKVADRMIEKTLPEVVAFFEYGGRQVVGANLTNRGNVYIEAVETSDAE
jgi:hypothetical protein